MSEKEYIVTPNKGVDYAQFNQDMIASTGAGDIPELLTLQMQDLDAKKYLLRTYR